MSRFNGLSWAVAIVLSCTVHVLAFTLIPSAASTDDERASGEQVAVSVAVAAANAFPTSDSQVITEPAMEATASGAEQAAEAVPVEAPEVSNPTVPQTTAVTEPEVPQSRQAKQVNETPVSTTVQVARLADQMSHAQLIEATSTATPVESRNVAEPAESVDSTEPVESLKAGEPVDNPKTVEPVATPETAKPVEATQSAKPVVKPKKKKRSNKAEKARKKKKKAKRRAKQNSTARSSASSRRKGSNNRNAGRGGKSSRAAGRAKLASYLGRVKSKIRRQNRGAKASGVSVVAFSIAGSGNVTAVRLKRSSGNTTLDKAAVRMVRRAAPFGPIPSDVGRRKLSLSVPIRFRLR